MIRVLAALLQEQRERLLMRPFWRLTAHFGQRLFSGSDDSGEGELSLGLGAMLALLATPGVFVTVLLFDKYSSISHFLLGIRQFDPYARSLPDQYFYFTLSMVITGVVVALKWDKIFPDRRDYMNLAPLPVRTRDIFVANITAIVVIEVFFAVDVNAVSSFFFPLLVMMEQGSFHDYLRFVAMHAVGVLLSSLFIFFALFAVIGTLMAILPGLVFRRLSLYLRVLVVVAMLALLCTSFAVPALLRDLAASHQILGWLPPVWFLGFGRSLIGKADPQLAHLGRQGIYLMLGAVLLAAMVYVLSYYRYFILIPETLDIAIRRREPRRLVPAWFVDGLLLRSPFERACYRFVMKTLLRNEKHSLLLGAFAGLGLVLAAQALVSAFVRRGFPPSPLPSADFLSAPLILAYFVICGARFVFDLPAELRANWAPQVIVDRERHDAPRVARKVILSLVWPWLLLIALPLYAYFWGWTIALGHSAVIMVLTYCLASWLLRSFRKIPFTCAYAPWKQNATVIIILYAVGFALFTSATTGWELRLLQRHPLYLWLLAPGLLVSWKVFTRFREDELDATELIFEDAPAPAVELLNLKSS